MVPGDVGNACSYSFPVRMKVIPGLADNPYPPLTAADGAWTPEVSSIINEVKALEAEGVRAIVTCCGFFSLIQEVLANEVDIPVVTSPIMIIPLVQRMIKKDRKVCIVTASRQLLSEEFFSAVGVKLDDRLVIAGLDDSEEFNASHMGGDSIEMNVEKLREEVVDTVMSAIEEEPAVAAILLECTTLPTFSADIRHATGLPVFDYFSCIDMLFRSVVPRKYEGFL
jgi:Asp/Glu/hydantoin racemase